MIAYDLFGFLEWFATVCIVIKAIELEWNVTILCLENIRGDFNAGSKQDVVPPFSSNGF